MITEAWLKKLFRFFYTNVFLKINARNQLLNVFLFKLSVHSHKKIKKSASLPPQKRFQVTELTYITSFTISGSHSYEMGYEKNTNKINSLTYT